MDKHDENGEHSARRRFADVEDRSLRLRKDSSAILEHVHELIADSRALREQSLKIRAKIETSRNPPRSFADRANGD